MKQDIVTPPVTDVLVAVVPRNGDAAAELWDVYLVNLRADAMENVLITSQGYGAIAGVDKSTTVLRHFHQHVAANSYQKIEPIQTELFGIQNEYWISFNDPAGMLDKRFVFQPGTISADALETVPVLDRPGVFLR